MHSHARAQQPERCCDAANVPAVPVLFSSCSAAQRPCQQLTSPPVPLPRRPQAGRRGPGAGAASACSAGRFCPACIARGAMADLLGTRASRRTPTSTCMLLSPPLPPCRTSTVSARRKGQHTRACATTRDPAGTTALPSLRARRQSRALSAGSCRLPGGLHAQASVSVRGLHATHGGARGRASSPRLAPLARARHTRPSHKRVASGTRVTLPATTITQQP